MSEGEEVDFKYCIDNAIELMKNRQDYAIKSLEENNQARFAVDTPSLVLDICIKKKQLGWE